MRIISKHQDYYDSAAAFGIDKSINLVRTQTSYVQPVKLGNHNVSLYKLPTATARTLLQLKLIFFCGELYPIVKTEFTDPKGRSINSGWLHSLDDLHEWMLDNKKFLRGTRALSLVEDPHKEALHIIYSAHHSIMEWFNDNPYSKEMAIETAFKNKVPYFMVEPDSLLYNAKAEITEYPVLKDYNFPKLFDSYSAHQAIEMYITGVLGIGEADTVEVSDDIKRDSHGFDNKSFKTTAPGKKHKRKKHNI